VGAVSYSKAGELIALATMAAGRHVGMTIEDVTEHFDVPKRTAQRMLSMLESQFPETAVRARPQRAMVRSLLGKRPSTTTAW